MTVVHKILKVQNDVIKPKFHNITDMLKEVLAESGVKNGIVVVYSGHTTCSVITQEECHDVLSDGTKYINQDLLEVFDSIIPKCDREGQYLHPGPDHIDVATSEFKEDATWSLNTDAHLRSCLIGRSETIPVIDGKLELGDFGVVYFIDFDSVRKRERKVHVQIIGE